VTGRAIWHSVAEEDLTEAYLYIGSDSPEMAERLLDAVGDSVGFLLENPLAGSPREFRGTESKGIRSWAPRDFPNYSIFYRPVGGDIEVVRFLHGARDLPRYLGEDG
jgi:plasmid stabilization system protein ParE